jgi:hypothetical protein
MLQVSVDPITIGPGRRALVDRSREDSGFGNPLEADLDPPRLDLGGAQHPSQIDAYVLFHRLDYGEVLEGTVLDGHDDG